MMVLVRPYFFEKHERRRRDLLQQKPVGAIEIEQRRKLGADDARDSRRGNKNRSPRPAA
jgi:hypothetical protein